MWVCVRVCDVLNLIGTSSYWVDGAKKTQPNHNKINLSKQTSVEQKQHRMLWMEMKEEKNKRTRQKTWKKEASCSSCGLAFYTRLSQIFPIDDEKPLEYSIFFYQNHWNNVFFSSFLCNSYRFNIRLVGPFLEGGKWFHLTDSHRRTKNSLLTVSIIKSLFAFLSCTHFSKRISNESGNSGESFSSQWKQVETI